MRRFGVGLLMLSLLTIAPRISVGASTDKAVAAIQKGDFKQAQKELAPLLEKNDPNAQFLTGMMYDAGKGVPQDPAKAASWYRKAAAQKHLMAQLYLGVLLYSGEGVKQDYEEAARQFAAPAEAGNEQAQFYLGRMRAEGQGVEKDENEAIELLSKSAAQRNTRAMGMLATTLFSRHRDDQDLIHAYAWAHLAAEMDPIQAGLSTREVIARYCSEDQKKQGKKLMADWKKRWAAEDKAAK